MSEKPYTKKQFIRAKQFWVFFLLPLLHLVRVIGLIYREPRNFIKYLFSSELRYIYIPALTAFVFYKYGGWPLWLVVYIECHIYERFLYKPPKPKE